MWPKSASIEKLVHEKRNLYKQGVFRSEDQAKAEQHAGKMTRLLREYEAENKFLYKKVEQLIGENYALKNRGSSRKDTGSKKQLGSTFKNKQMPEFILLNHINSTRSENLIQRGN